MGTLKKAFFDEDTNNVNNNMLALDQLARGVCLLKIIKLIEIDRFSYIYRKFPQLTKYINLIEKTFLILLPLEHCAKTQLATFSTKIATDQLPYWQMTIP